MRVRVAGESPEATAREARYAALAARLRPGELLLTAHHGDDQLETVLLQWLRGGGLAAVAGMRPLSRFASGWLARPLLGWTRDELRQWAVPARLEWLEDPSNADPRFDRNYLRLEVLPALRARWPAAARTVGRVAAQAAEALDLEAEFAAVGLAPITEGETLAIAGLVPHAVARQRWLLRCVAAGARARATLGGDTGVHAARHVVGRREPHPRDAMARRRREALSGAPARRDRGRGRRAVAARGVVARPAVRPRAARLPGTGRDDRPGSQS